MRTILICQTMWPIGHLAVRGRAGVPVEKGQNLLRNEVLTCMLNHLGRRLEAECADHTHHLGQQPD